MTNLELANLSHSTSAISTTDASPIEDGSGLLPAAMKSLRPQRFERVLAGCGATVACAVLLVAAFVNPYDETGRPLTHGTHRQLGLSSCAMLSAIGFPCPACGMTTSVALVLHGDILAAWHANWAGVIVTALGSVVAIWLGLLSCGMPRHQRLSADRTIVALTIGGASVVFVRYAGLLSSYFASGDG